MSIKLIAVDMDGTFLHEDKSYDRPRFQKQYEQLKALGIHVAVASGNQLFRLQAYFDDYPYPLSFVAENGAYVKLHERDLSITTLAPEHHAAVFSFLSNHPDCLAIVCGLTCAYVLDTISAPALANSRNYYRELKTIKSYDEIDDKILKIALNLNDYDQALITSTAEKELDGILTPVTSGHQFMDLIMPGIHKAHGLSILQRELGIDDSEVAAFGDNGNDLEMLRQAGFGFAMGNAVPKAQEAARYLIGKNDDDSVLDMLDIIIKCAEDSTDMEEAFQHLAR